MTYIFFFALCKAICYHVIKISLNSMSILLTFTAESLNDL